MFTAYLQGSVGFDEFDAGEADDALERLTDDIGVLVANGHEPLTLVGGRGGLPRLRELRARAVERDASDLRALAGSVAGFLRR